MISLYQLLLDTGAQMDNHEGGLYVLVTPETSAVIRMSRHSVSTFISQIDGKLWFDLPFAYEPFWERKTR